MSDSNADKRCGVKKYQNFLLYRRKIFSEQKNRHRTDFESEDFGIWDSFGLRVDINVLVLPGEVSRYQLSGLWTLAGGSMTSEISGFQFPTISSLHQRLFLPTEMMGMGEAPGRSINL